MSNDERNLLALKIIFKMQAEGFSFQLGDYEGKYVCRFLVYNYNILPPKISDLSVAFENDLLDSVIHAAEATLKSNPNIKSLSIINGQCNFS